MTTPSIIASSGLDRNQILLDFVLQHASDDARPYLKLTIFNCPILGLLDSGASRTVAGNTGYILMQRLGLTLQVRQTQCSVANGQKCISIGYVSAPICLMGKIRLIDILVVPDIPHTLILGVDFWRAMGIVPDLRQDVWHFSESSDSLEICSIQGETSLTVEQYELLNTLIDNKLSRMGTKLGKTTLVEHDIELLPDTKPIKQRYYPVSPHKQRIIDDELEKMLGENVIEPCKSPWSSPVCLVPKKDGTYRFCIDFRQLNAVTKKDAYPLPYISSILDQLRNARYLSTIDIKSAYWQVPVKESCRDYTAFTVPGRGLYRFCRMPFGLTNAPATFQRLVDSILGPELQPSVLVYLDDIVVVSSDFNSHLEDLKNVLDRLIGAGLVVSREKCKFCRTELKYLGFIVDKNGLRPDPDKVNAILNLPRPKNATDIRRFIGTASWYRRFIPNFSTILSPLSQLVRKNSKWNWTDECDSSFQSIKEQLVSAPILYCPDFSRPFTLQTDASAYGIGAVLSQDLDDGEHVISYLSRSLTRQEQKYSTTERECLAVIWSVEKLRHYLEGVPFVVITDHHSLLWLHRLKDPQGRLARWALRLQPYNFTIIHRKGKDHVVPDLLSRSVPIVGLVSETKVSPADKWYVAMCRRVVEHPANYPQWRVEKGKLYKYVHNRIPELSNDIDNWKIVVPKEDRLSVLQRDHDDVTSGHLGIHKTYSRICQNFYWPKLKPDVYNYVRKCPTCAAYKTEQKLPAGLMGNRPAVWQPWQLISADFVGPFPRSPAGYTALLVITDYFSKYVLTFPVRSANAKTLAKILEENVFLVFGAPQYFMSDNGGPFRSTEVQSLCKKYGVKTFFTALYYPRANHTERTNKVLKTMISTYVKDSHRHWDRNIAALTCAIRTTQHETTGYSPYYINFGREMKVLGSDFDNSPEPNLEVDIASEVEQRRLGFEKLYKGVAAKIRLASERNKRIYDLRRRSQQYEVGDEVWRRNKCVSDATRFFSAKLAPRFLGPFIVKRKTGSWTYELQDDVGISKGIWHVQDLKPVVNDDHG